MKFLGFVGWSVGWLVGWLYVWLSVRLHVAGVFVTTFGTCSARLLWLCLVIAAIGIGVPGVAVVVRQLCLSFVGAGDVMSVV